MLQLSCCSEPLLAAAAAAAAAKSSLQLCLTLCDPIGGSPPAPLSLGFFRQEYWSRLPFPFPPCSRQLEKSPRSNEDPAQPQINKVFLKSVHVYIVLLEWLKKKNLPCIVQLLAFCGVFLSRLFFIYHSSLLALNCYDHTIHPILYLPF